MTLFLYSGALSGNTGAEDRPEVQADDPPAIFRVEGALSDDLYGRCDEGLRMSGLSGGRRRFVHRAAVEVRPGFIIRSNPFLRGENERRLPIRNSASVHLKYSFQSQAKSCVERIFGGSYQGIGAAYYTFGERKQLGNPVAFYLFQGARIAEISRRRVSLHYEWNFGLSAGWRPYDKVVNPYNTIIGSEINAYINMNVYLEWMLSGKFGVATGVTLSHFSNGNTRYPNAGLNTFGLKSGLIYYFNRENGSLPASRLCSSIAEFPRHVSYDLVLFGSWRRKGIMLGENMIALSDVYRVFGFSFAPMYNWGYRFRTGVSLDGFYDGSTNIYTVDYIAGTVPHFFKPPLYKQLSAGISGRVEYVMPYFSVNLGMGINVLHNESDLKRLYQVLALKIEVTRNSFIHIGYSLQQFKTPNFLMLGLGLRFNNRYPTFWR